jgi:putative transposase
MPYKKHIEDPSLPFHITARSINKEWFVDIDEVWLIFENYLYYLKVAYDVEIFSFVLMSNHFHLLARFPKANASLAMQYFMRETSKRISKPAERINQVYGGRFFRSAINTHHYYNHVYKYVYRNPVDAKLCQRVAR